MATRFAQRIITIFFAGIFIAFTYSSAFTQTGPSPQPESAAVLADGTVVTPADSAPLSLPPISSHGDAKISKKASYRTGEFVVKFKTQGPYALQECAHCLLARRKEFRSAIVDPSDSLDQLNKRHGVTSARALFTERHDLTTGQAVEQLARKIKNIQGTFTARTKRTVHPSHKRNESDIADDLMNTYVFEVPTDADIEKICALFKADPHVEFAHPNYTAGVQMSLNDPFYSSSGSWGQGYEDLWGLKKIQIDPAWDISQGTGMVVAVVDTGLDYNHPDIAANVWTNTSEISGNGADDDGNGKIDDIRGWDFAYENNDVLDRQGHGTHVSGTIAAIANNNQGIVGVAPLAKIMPVKGLDDSGSGSVDRLAQGIIYAVMNGADVVNNSWGCTQECPSVPVVENAVRTAYGLGAPVIFAAGNSNADVSQYSPLNMAETIKVAASDHMDQKSDFSNYGMLIDVAAPGGDSWDGTSEFLYRNILSLRADGTDIQGNPQQIVANAYYRVAGTSMAAPHVAGLAALILSRRPNFSVEQVRQAIRHGSDDAGSISGFDIYEGHGRINALKALNESSPLEVLITSPVVMTATNVDQIDILGTVMGSGLGYWLLEAGPGNSPLSWTPLGTSGGPVVNAPLGLWDIRNVPDGQYTLRLQGQSVFGGTYEDRKAVTIDQVEITQPAPTQISYFRSGQTIAVTGLVRPANFLQYSVQIRKSNGSLLGNPSIDLANSGTQRVIYGPLATWDTTNIPADHYAVELVVALTEGPPIIEKAEVVVDPDLHAGWPQNLGGIAFGGPGFQLALLDHLNTADINGDGPSEILIGYGSTVRILDHTGANLPGWPQPINTVNGSSITQRGPTAADITGDGVPEVVAGTGSGQIYIWGKNGTLLPGWPRTVGFGSLKIVVDDIDGNGANDIIAADSNGTIHVVDPNGLPLPGWPQTLNFESSLKFVQYPAVGDVNGDGKKEIVVMQSSWPSNIFVLDSAGNVLPGWPKAVNGNDPRGFTNVSYPALADVDQDGTLEVIASSMNGYVYAFRHDGTDAPGWPQFVQDVQMRSPAVGDIDGDGQPEIVAGTNYFYNPATQSFSGPHLYAWHGNGTLLSGWPVTPVNSVNDCYAFDSPILADVNGDGVNDVVASCFDAKTKPFTLYAYQGTGVKINGFPKPTGKASASEINTAVVDDLNNDGLAEMAWVDYDFNLYVWDLVAPKNSLPSWPMFHHDSQHTGRAETTGQTNQAPVLNPIGNKTVNEGQFLSFSVPATDPNLGDQLTFSVSGLPSGAGFDPLSKVFSWTPGHQQAGNYAIAFTVSDGLLSDDESIAITVTNVPAADLLVSGLSTPPGAIAPEASLRVTITVKNRQYPATPAFMVAFVLSPDSVYGGAGDIAFATTLPFDPLAGNTNRRVSSSLEIPGHTPPGNYYLCAFVDSVSGVGEESETNNTLCTTSWVPVVRSDFAMINVKGPTAGSRGNPITVTDTVRNYGGKSASFSVGFYLSTDSTITTSDTFLGSRSLSTLASGGSSKTSTTMTIPASVPTGLYYIGAIADYNNARLESQETNNALAGNTIVITNP